MLGRLGRRRIGVAALAAAAVIAGATWLAVQRGWLPGAQPKPPILAVLPFRNETDDPEGTRYIADGLAEALATNLAQTERLSVLPWITTQRVALDSLSLPRLAKDLNARRLLLGTMRNTPNGLSVSLSLVDGASGTQTWSRPFEGTADQLPSLEARMLFEAATALLGRLTPDERARMELPSGRNGAAYSLYLEGASHLRAGDPASLVIAEQFFRRSIELDSMFADAHVGMGAVLHARMFLGLEDDDRNVSLARSHFLRAYRLEPMSPLAMQAQAEILIEDGRFRDALAVALRAMHTRPRTTSHELVAGRIYTAVLPKVGLRICKDILVEDPSDPAARYFAVLAAAFSGQLDDVQTQGAEYIRRFGEDAEVYLWMSLAALRGGENNKALMLARRAHEIEGDGGDLRALDNLAGVEQVVLGPAQAAARWRKLHDLAEDRIRRGMTGVNLHLLPQIAAAMLGDSAEVLRRRMARPGLGQERGAPDYRMRFMIRIGRRDLAQEDFDELTRRQWGVEGRPRNLNQIEEELIAPDDDPLVAAYLDQKLARHATLMAEFGNPWATP
jgi:TolB-like protein